MHRPTQLQTLIRTTTHGELTLRYRDEGAGAPLLLVHGFFGSGEDFDHLPGLGRGMRCLRPDLRGHGASFSPDHRFSFQEAAQDLGGLLDLLGIERCHAVGLSAGALTVLRLALLRPDAIDRLVLVSACAAFPPEARSYMRAHVEKARSARDLTPALDPLLATAEGFARGEDDATLTPEELATISSPTLLVAGDRDPLYPVEVSVHLYRQLAHAALWVVPGAGHTPVFGDARHEFVRRAHAFLTQT